MSAPLKPTFRPTGIANIDIDAAVKLVEEHSKENNIKSLTATGTPPAPKPVEKPAEVQAPVAKPQKTSQAQAESKVTIRRLSVELPDYILTAVKRRAAEEDTTIRYIISRALRKDGFKFESGDLVEDGRRES